MSNNTNNSPDNNKRRTKRIGFQSMPIETVRQIARKGGTAPHRLPQGVAALDRETRKRIAALGGNTTKETYGIEYYQDLGKRGIATVIEKYSETFLSDLRKTRKKKK